MSEKSPDIPTEDGVTPDESEHEYPHSEVRKITLAVIAGVVFGGVATGVAFPTLPLLGDILGISAIMLGIILSANRIARLIMNTPAGQVIDSVGVRRPMIIGLFVQGFAPFLYIVGLHTPRGTFAVLPFIGDVSNPSIVFVLARCFWGLGSAFVIIGAFVIITRITTPSNRGKWVGYLRGGQSLGFPTGLVLGGAITDVFDAQTAFLVAGVLAIVAAFVAYLVIPEVESAADSRTTLRDIPRIIRDEPRVLPVGLGNFIIRFMFAGVLLTTVVIYADAYSIQVSGLEAAGVGGLVMGIGVIISGATTVVSGRISDGLDNRIVVTMPALAVLAVGFGVLAFYPTFLGILASTVMVGFGVGGTGPALLAYLGDISPGDRLGKLGGVYNVMGDVGLALAPLIAVPAVEDWFGYRTTYVGCALLTLACLVVVNVTLIRK
ncbi:MAG: MFS transporter [Halobacteriales archaeon]|nr:MFS transporter [Halobacteriales archaeon]